MFRKQGTCICRYERIGTSLSNPFWNEYIQNSVNPPLPLIWNSIMLKTGQQMYNAAININICYPLMAMIAIIETHRRTENPTKIGRSHYCENTLLLLSQQILLSNKSGSQTLTGWCKISLRRHRHIDATMLTYVEVSFDFSQRST